MQAFRVTFDIGGASGLSEVLLVEGQHQLEKALESKTEERFIAGRPTCKIVGTKQLPLSKVKIADLSISEFLLLKDMG